MSSHFYYQLGKKGEIVAKYYLQKHNYKIIGSNIKLGYYELDIIAQQKSSIVFIEVKTNLEKPFNKSEILLTRKQIKNIKKGVGRYCHQKKIVFNDTRIDLLQLTYKKVKEIITISHYKDIM